LVDTFGDVDRRAPGQCGYAPMASQQHQQKRRKLPRKQRSLGKRVSTPRRSLEMPTHPAGLDPSVAETIEALARTMVDNENNKQRRLVEFKDGCRYGKFGKTKAYELIAQQRIRAYKMGSKTMIDLDSVDEYHASLPRVVSRAS
jgi:excisionase family DNA binding protein